MQIHIPGLYHVYNRGNHQEPIFSNKEDYSAFINYCQRYILTRADILAWCLMPNHFHFLIEISEQGLLPLKWGGNEMASISNGFQILQSAFAKWKNARSGMKGSFFQQRAKSKLIENDEYTRICFWYIHFNPVAAKIVENMAEWPYSSYRGFCGLSNDLLLNKDRALEITGFSEMDFLNLPKEFLNASLPWMN